MEYYFDDLLAGMMRASWRKNNDHNDVGGDADNDGAGEVVMMKTMSSPIL